MLRILRGGSSKKTRTSDSDCETHGRNTFADAEGQGMTHALGVKIGTEEMVPDREQGSEVRPVVRRIVTVK